MTHIVHRHLRTIPPLAVGGQGVFLTDASGAQYLDASGGAVKLSGIVVSDDERAAAEQVTAAVSGVTSVDNQLRVMKMSRLFPSAKN